MRTRHLQTRFILAGVALVMMTVVSGLWSAWTFARLSTVAGRTIRSSQRIIDLTAAISNGLEREDDAFLIAMSGDREQAQQKLSGERRELAALYSELLVSLDEPNEKRAAVALQKHVDQYHGAGDALLSLTDQRAMTTAYQQHVNPAHCVRRWATAPGFANSTSARCNSRRSASAMTRGERRSW